MSPAPVVKAFDDEAIHEGNFALGIDHEKVSQETDALLARMSLDLVFAWIVIRGIHFRLYRNRDLAFTYLLFNVITFSRISRSCGWFETASR